MMGHNGPLPPLKKRIDYVGTVQGTSSKEFHKELKKIKENIALLEKKLEQNKTISTRIYDWIYDSIKRIKEGMNK